MVAVVLLNFLNYLVYAVEQTEKYAIEQTEKKFLALASSS